MSNEASEWEVHKTSSTITAAQAMSKLSMVGAEASISTREYERRIVNASTTSSIVSAEASMSAREYERRIVNASTTSSTVSAETSMLTREYERRKADAHTVVSIVNAETTMSAREYERRILNASSTSSIVSAETSMSTREYERRKVKASTVVSIISAETTMSAREYEWRKVNASSTSSIVSAETSMSMREYERIKADARTAISIRNAERSKSATEYERKKMDARTISSIETTKEDVVESDEDFILTEAQPQARQFRAYVPLPPLTDPITFTVEERLNVLRDGYSFTNLDVEGTLSLQILNQEDGFIQVEVESGGNLDMLFTSHPNINKELIFSERILCFKDPSMPFPSGGVVLLNWRLESDDESILPLSIDCLSDRDFSENGTYVCIEYGSLTTFDLQNVIISIPLPALRDAPPVWLTTGEWRYDSSLEWFIPLIDDSNGSGSLGFVVPSADLSVFFPISVQFTTSNTISGLKVTNVLPLRDGPPPKFAQRTQLITESYQVVE